MRADPVMTSLWIILCSPSGGGKTTLARALAASADGFRVSVSATTRNPRGNEKNGREYHFIGPEQFRARATGGQFLEWAEVHGNFYGTSRSETAGSDNVIFDVDHQGARKLKAIRPDALTVFVLPPSLDVLRQRLTARATDDTEAIEARLEAATSEISHYDAFDYIIVNDDFDEALWDLKAIARAERCAIRKPAGLAEALLRAEAPFGDSVSD